MADQILIALQPLHLFRADLLDQSGPVNHDVAAQVGIALRAGLVHVPEVEAQVCCGADAAEMRAVPLPTPVRRLVAAYAAQMSVTQPDVAVENGLGLPGMVRPALQLLLADFDLSALNLSQRLARLLQVHVLGGQCTGWTAHRLPETLRYELDRARSVTACFRFGLLGDHAASLLSKSANTTPLAVNSAAMRSVYATP